MKQFFVVWVIGVPVAALIAALLSFFAFRYETNLTNMWGQSGRDLQPFVTSTDKRYVVDSDGPYTISARGVPFNIIVVQNDGQKLAFSCHPFVGECVTDDNIAKSGSFTVDEKVVVQLRSPTIISVSSVYLVDDNDRFVHSYLIPWITALLIVWTALWIIAQLPM